MGIIPNDGNSTLLLPTMNSRDLNPEQINRIEERLSDQESYLARLQERMEQQQFPPDDPVYESASRAKLAIRDLRVKLQILVTGGEDKPCEKIPPSLELNQIARSVRARKLMYRLEIFSVEQLCTWSPEGLKMYGKFHNIGWKTIGEIRKALRKNGLYLKGDSEELLIKFGVIAPGK